ncbi:MAG: hypothetical protein IIY93_09565 [Clostridia bacterium]|nr:hypothetical protein [Clostridia bacterium]MBQ1555232.1 hypothetical protein [Clostridia bacterium]
MAKWFGHIGFVRTVETAPDVWQEQKEERAYYGDLTRNSRRWQSSGKLNDNVMISNEISVISDPFAFENAQYLRYVTFAGAKWTISSVEAQYPRLVLTIGEVYHE